MLIKKLYEDQVKGLIPERQCKKLLEQYDDEQSQLEEEVAKLEEEN